MADEVNSQRNCTDLLIQCMEDFSNNQPNVICVIYIDNEGSVTCRSNGGLANVLGMMEMAKKLLLND